MIESHWKFLEQVIDQWAVVTPNPTDRQSFRCWKKRKNRKENRNISTKSQLDPFFKTRLPQPPIKALVTVNLAFGPGSNDLKVIQCFEEGPKMQVFCSRLDGWATCGGPSGASCSILWTKLHTLITFVGREVCSPTRGPTSPHHHQHHHSVLHRPGLGSDWDQHSSMPIKPHSELSPHSLHQTKRVLRIVSSLALSTRTRKSQILSKCAPPPPIPPPPPLPAQYFLLSQWPFFHAKLYLGSSQHHYEIRSDLWALTIWHVCTLTPGTYFALKRQIWIFILSRV